jgi:hypothetical protein
MVICPKCGHDFVARAEIGTGTRKAVNTKLNANRVNIIRVMKGLNKFSTVKDIQNKLFEKNIYRKSRNVGGPGWNYHTVQADMSILLASGYVVMSNDPNEFFDKSFGHQTDKTPRYKLTKKGEDVQYAGN